jgi:DNA-directed RNA polymerase subunit K/omega
MEDAPELESPVVEAENPETVEAPAAPLEPAAPITSRFLYVDVAALRAKQLRRGARVRFDVEPGTPAPHKPERVAMEEVKRRLVQYEVPPWKSKGEDQA